MQRKNLFDEAEQVRAEMIVQEITDRGMQIRINGTWYTAVELQGGRVDFTPVYGLERPRIPIKIYAVACRKVHAVLNAFRERRARVVAGDPELGLSGEEKKQHELF